MIHDGVSPLKGERNRSFKQVHFPVFAFILLVKIFFPVDNHILSVLCALETILP